MSIIGLAVFIGGAIVIAGSSRIVYQWFERHTFRPDDDPDWRLYCAAMSMLLGVLVFLVCVLVLVVFLMLVFPDHMS
ncbi:hypothetical protein BW14_07035 [Bifidobacterium sp. UTBIF-68]|uniref:hypothetical protein n=1 Tax=Bifidobacterium sp. UTBIF-68 TaxID=1465262 RepID=UPI00112BD32B|nr:hypothetical protein [Bifidobacterium sp. UTBIF-68]TPF92909.1 hypothetical protein BW14_07035 [Bifidobacterium sp. UTBIF-68]